MASSVTSVTLPTGAPTARGDEFDDLFDYDVDLENDPFSANYKAPGSDEGGKQSTRTGASGNALGIDEEIEVTRKPRIPRVKLDEHRLLSQNGIPKLRKKAKSDLRLKGKGHEYSDAARLLAFYQLWLDDLFPKARFLDALSMVEKMGHKKMLQSARMEWIDEGKPKAVDLDDALYDDPAVLPVDGSDKRDTSRIAPIFEKRVPERTTTPTRDTTRDTQDLYDATPRGARRSSPADVPGSQDSLFGGANQSIFGPKTTNAQGDNDIGDDELDALLREEDALRAKPQTIRAEPVVSKTATADDFEDEMEAMADMEGMW